jgi:tyrosinase
MRALPASDRRSWSFQAAIHGTDAGPPDPLFNQCEHGTLQFFTWHRGYLYYFERILRWAAQDPTLCLPYWDWTADPVLPEPFRLPASSTNPLYEAQRAANSGAALPAPVVVDDLTNALAETTFPPTPGPGFSPLLEGSPHGAIHVLVGGFGGLMSAVSRAARDPIFWLHHANIDRLWDHWLNLGGGRTNPADAAFLDKTYTLADEADQTVTFKVRDVISSAALGYRYDTVPNPPAAVVGMAMMMAAKGGPVPVAATSAAADVPAKPLRLEPERVKLTPIAAQRAALAAPARVTVTVEGIAADEPPSYVYGVYLNLPEGEVSEADRRAHYVGSIDFFGKTKADRRGGGHEHAAGGTFDATLVATRAVARLRQAGKWDADALTVTILPITLTPTDRTQEQIRTQAVASAKQANVSYKRVTIRVGP